MSLQPTRNSCQICHVRMGLDFHVPTDTWEAVMHRNYWGGPVCINCFIREADEKLIEWEVEIIFFPVSLFTHLSNFNGLKPYTAEQE